MLNIYQLIVDPFIIPDKNFMLTAQTLDYCHPSSTVRVSYKIQDEKEKVFYLKVFYDNRGYMVYYCKSDLSKIAQSILNKMIWSGIRPVDKKTMQSILKH